MQKVHFYLILIFSLATLVQPGWSQTPRIILGRPTDKEITLNLMSDKDLEVKIDFGTQPDSLASTTGFQALESGVPINLEIGNLNAGTRYYYKLLSRISADSPSTSSPVYCFQTQRAPGIPFVFTLESDPHPYDKKGCHALWDICLANQLLDSPDFMIDLGDTFGDDHQPFTINDLQVKQLQLNARGHIAGVCHSIPFFFGLGNHEGESGYYLLQNPPENLGIYETLWRKRLFPNPLPNAFYTGNTQQEPYGIGNPANYYAWEWGDALLVVLDPYRYYTANAKPRGWDWTLGKAQYDWLKNTLESSNARFKLVFAHHIAGESRGAVKLAQLYEWGGYNQTGTWEFGQYRPEWGLPIHQLMVKNRVTAFFQGHDHLFAKEELDGIVYQEIPMPSDSTYAIGMLANADAYLSNQTGGSGHLRVTVTPDSIGVEFVQAFLPADESSIRKNRQVAFSYWMKASATGISKSQVPSAPVYETSLYPNPVIDQAIIQYKLKSELPVILTILDSRGREMDTLVRETQIPGIYQIAFDPSEMGCKPGILYARIQAGAWQKYIKIIYTKQN